MDTHLGYHPPVRPTLDPLRIGRRLRDRRDELTDAWRVMVAAECGSVRAGREPALLEIVPALLDRLGQLISTQEPATRAAIDRTLGANLPGVTADDDDGLIGLTREYQALIRVVLPELVDAPAAARDTALIVLQRAITRTLERASERGRPGVASTAAPRPPGATVPHRGWRGLVVAAVGVATATICQTLLWPIVRPAPYLLYFPALILVSFYGNGWVALALSAAATHLLFSDLGAFAADVVWYEPFARGGLFIGAGAMILFLRRTVIRAQARARAEQARSVAFAGLQKALADVGRLGVRQTEVASLLNASAARIAAGLSASVVKILEFDSAKRIFLIRATSGLTGEVFEPEITAADDPQAFFTLDAERPVTVESFADETRFSLPPCLRTKDIRSSVSVAIPGQHAPFGVLLVYATDSRIFTRDEKSFAQTVAVTLANAIERRRGEARLRELNVELGRSNAELNRFAAIAAHDLKAPLNSVSQFAELIEASAPADWAPQTANYFRIIARATDRMRNLVDRLLTYSRVGAQDAPREIVDVGVVCAAVVQDLRSSIERAGALVTLGPLPEARGDEVELRQLFQNLISNAIKFVGDRRPEVHVGCVAVEAGWQFVVRDNGIGINANDATHIFEPFRRLRASVYEGTGLGLAICLRIVERHGGRIWMESRPGAGTSFFFTLPRESFRDA